MFYIYVHIYVDKSEIEGNFILIYVRVIAQLSIYLIFYVIIPIFGIFGALVHRFCGYIKLFSIVLYCHSCTVLSSIDTYFRCSFINGDSSVVLLTDHPLNFFTRCWVWQQDPPVINMTDPHSFE
jgi:hypothetical protein